MSRKLKFRAWDKLEKRFIYPDKGYQGHYVLDLNGRFYNLQNGSGGNEYVVQQYTGVKDIDTKEIYEGDIIQIEKMSDSDNLIFKYVGTVSFFNGSLTVIGEHNYIKDKLTIFKYNLYEICNQAYNFKLKVIGNNFENE